MHSTKDWIVEWFTKHGKLGKGTVAGHTADNYFNEGWIDSFTFITLISDLEEHFKVRFANDEFQNRGFSTIDGLAQIIDHKLHGAQ